jgi:dUTP pyrophosphatase
MISLPFVEVRVLDERLRTWGLPSYQSADAAAVDLHACTDHVLLIAPESPAVLVPAGIAIHIGDPGVAAMILPRSGLGHTAGLVLGNSVGLLDADYLGPVSISVWNRNPHGTDPIRITPGDRIAQLVFVPILRPSFRVVEAFSRTTERGESGFGSTGTGPPPERGA